MRRIVLVALLATEAQGQGAATGGASASATPPNSGAGAPVDAATSASKIGIRLDCTHDFNLDKGSTQACFSITGLRYEHAHVLSPQLSARVRLDPFATLDPGKADTPLRKDVPLVRDTPFLVIDDYALTWTPRPNLEVAAESYGGAARLPRITGLALAQPFVDPGWKQTALSVTYNLAALADMRVKFAIGNGEGENGENRDPQQYGGFELSASIIEGAQVALGVSQDGNSAGGAEYDYLLERYETNCDFSPTGKEPRTGHQTQRIALAFLLDGRLPAAPGLKLALGAQRITLSDQNKATKSYPGVADLDKCGRFDADYLFVENTPGADPSTVEKFIYSASAAYTIFGNSFVALDYGARRIDTGNVKAFETCAAYQNGTCVAPSGSYQNKLAQTSIVAGGGLTLTPGLVVTAEYGRISYDRRYAHLYYLDQKGKTSQTQELFNARVAYNWR